MKLKIKVHPNSSMEKIVKVSEKDFEVWTKEKPIEGRANEKVEKILKKELGLKGKIVSGFNSRIKTFEGEFI